jgi:hypothetical protein
MSASNGACYYDARGDLDLVNKDGTLELFRSSLKEAFYKGHLREDLYSYLVC